MLLNETASKTGTASVWRRKGSVEIRIQNQRAAISPRGRRLPFETSQSSAPHLPCVKPSLACLQPDALLHAMRMVLPREGLQSKQTSAALSGASIATLNLEFAKYASVCITYKLQSAPQSKRQRRGRRGRDVHRPIRKPFVFMLSCCCCCCCCSEQRQK